MRLEVARAADLRQAIEIAWGRLTELLAYLDAVVAQANRLPPYYPREARMERVRVRVRVSSRRKKFDPAQAAERERERRMWGAHDEEGFRVYAHRFGPDGSDREKREERTEIQVLDWDDKVRDKVRRGVVVGDPGLGKTWLLKWEAARHAAEAAAVLRQTGDLARVTLPVYRRLTDLADALHTLAERRKHGTADVPTLAEAVVESLRRFQLPGPEGGSSRGLSDRVLDLVRQQLGTDRCLLLLDAFDEVPADRRKDLLRSLEEWVPRNAQARILAQARFLFTSRVIGYEPPWDLPDGSEAEREMELLPFDDDQMGTFINSFFAGEPAAAREMRELLRRAPQLRGMAQIPLLLGFLCALYRDERGKPEGQKRNLGRFRRTDLYGAVLQKLLSGEWREQREKLPPPNVKLKLRLLTNIAHELFQQGKEQFSCTDLADTIQVIWGWSTGPLPKVQENQVTEMINELSQRDGVLVQAGAGEDSPYLFLHLTFQEYLTACHLADLINEHGWEEATVRVKGKGKAALVKDLVDRRAWLPAWQEVIVLLAGRLNDPVPLLELLADESKDDLFHHRLALAAHCLPEIQKLLPQQGP